MRALVADAAVLGTTFPGEALVAVSGRPAGQVEAALADLLRREVLEISADPLSPQRGQYKFGQNMLRQVAYDTLSRRARKARHLAVAAHLQATFDGDEMAEVVARHYLDALTAVEGDPDADEIRAKAIAALVRAGERAEAAGAPDRAAADFAEAADRTVRLPDADAARLWERAAHNARNAGDYARMSVNAERARDGYAACGLERDAARATVEMGAAARLTGHNAQGRALVEAALEVLRPDPDADTVSALRHLASGEIFAGSTEGGDVSEEALVLGQALDLPDNTLADLFMVRAMDYDNRNQHAQARALYEYAVQLAARTADSFGQARALSNHASATTAFDPAASEASSRRAVEILSRIGDCWLLPTACANLGVALIVRGEWTEAERTLINTIDDLGSTGGHALVATYAALSALRGDLDKARNLATLETSRASDDPQDRSEALFADALIAAAEGNPAEALRCAREIVVSYERALGLSHELFYLSWPVAVRAAFEIGDEQAVRELIALLDAHPVGHLPPILRAERTLARARLRDTDADAALVDAVAQVRAVGSPFHLAHALLDLAQYRIPTSAAPVEPLISEAVAIADQLQARPLAARAQTVRRAQAAKV